MHDKAFYAINNAKLLKLCEAFIPFNLTDQNNGHDYWPLE